MRGISQQRCEILPSVEILLAGLHDFRRVNYDLHSRHRRYTLKAYFIALHSALLRFFIACSSLLSIVYAMLLDKQRVYPTE